MSNGGGQLNEKSGRVWLDIGSKLAPMVTACVNLVVLVIVFSQFRVNQAQFILNERASNRAWSAQLIETLYKRKECALPDCPPAATLRSREEALLAYIELRRRYGESINLREGVFSSMSLFGIDFKEATLENSKFQATDLEGADFRGAHLDNAVFGVCPDFEASTGLAHRRGPKGVEPARNTSLRGAKLAGAVFDNVSMCGVDISGLDLSLVQNLTQSQIDSAIGDEKTRFPTHIHRPKKWGSSSRSPSFP
jgi:hypothetical protein